MNGLNRLLTASFIFLILSSLLVTSFTSTTVQAASKPSVPQFSVKFVDNSYDVPASTTTATDPYTGKETTTTHLGYHVEKYDLEVTIKKQSFTSYTNADGYTCNLYCNVQVKGHFEENWKVFYSDSQSYVFIMWSGSQDIVVSYTLCEYDATMFLGKPPSGSQLDFRVEAFAGYWRDPMPQESALGIREQILVRDESSGWSDIQTITITYDASLSLPSQTVTSPENTSTPSDGKPTSPTDSTTQKNFATSVNILLGVIVILLCVTVVLVIMFFRRQPKKPTTSN
jgi:hypothetical protein